MVTEMTLVLLGATCSVDFQQYNNRKEFEMRWIISAIGCWILASHLGCHHSCGNSFPMQGMTRVPPPGTGSYPVQGGYYNAPMGMQSAMPMDGGASSVASNPPSGFQAGGSSVVAGQNQGFGPNPSASVPPGETFATYEMPQSYGTNPGNAMSQPAPVTTAGGAGGFQGQANPVVSASLSDSVPSLQWQQ